MCLSIEAEDNAVRRGLKNKKNVLKFSSTFTALVVFRKIE